MHPNDGEVMMAAHLRTRAICIPRARLRASIHRIDPHASENRRAAIRRRTYSVPSPNSVWHLDGNHKLIRWRFVVHGGIDGYSRVAVYVNCSTNNKATTVLPLFTKAVDEFGLPDRVRTDLGGENSAVWQFMVDEHNGDASCVVVGSSTHNTRIERLWRDVHRCVLRPFGDVFRTLEQEEVLDPLNEVDIYSLHYCFQPRIKCCLAKWQESWNNHQVSTERNATPYQLYITGLLSSNTIPQTCQPLPQPPACSSPQPRPGDTVEVPRSRFLPCSMLIHLLKNNFDPLCGQNYFDDRMYRDVIHVMAQHLITCTSCTET